MSIRYLVTGAQGFVGRYLVDELLKSDQDAEVIGLGRSPSNNDEFTHSVSWGASRIPAPLQEQYRPDVYGKRHQYIALDLQKTTALTQILRNYQPDVIFHMAAALRGDSPDFLFQTNVAVTIGLLQSIKDSGIKLGRLVIGSTGGVYGIPTPGSLPFDEEWHCQPADLYSASKLSAEHISRVMAAESDIPTVWARMFNLVGPGQDERHVCGKFASCMAAIIEKRQPPKIEMGQLETTRDFIDVRDIASALKLLSKNDGPTGIFNIASGKETSIQSILTMILEISGLADVVETKITSTHKAGVPRHYGKIDRLVKLGFEPRYSLEQSLRDLLDYYLGAVAKAA